MTRSRTARLALAAASVVLLPGCSTIGDIFTSPAKSDIKGERISIMAMEQQLEADPRLADVEIKLPPPYRNPDWPEPGGYSDNVMHHLEASGPLNEAWSTDTGKGSDSTSRLTAPPIIAEGRIYVLDAASNVFAFDARGGEKVWEAKIAPAKERGSWLTMFGMFGSNPNDPVKGFGGGVAYDEGRIFVASGFGFVKALDAATGREIWTSDMPVPIRNAPVANGGRVFVITQENQLFVLAASDGRVLWDHRGITESAGIMSSTSAAVAGEFVIVPYTSGELFALRVQNGRVAWSDSLSRTGNVTALTSLNDIAGRPAIDRGLVFAISHSGRLVAIDIRTGERVWSRNIGGIQTPWVAGDFIYLVSEDAQLVCLARRDGRVKWIKQLQRYEDEDEKQNPIVWSGPVVVSDRLLLVSSDGYAVSISPYTGALLGRVEIPDGTFIPPVVANETVYILTNDAELVALR